MNPVELPCARELFAQWQRARGGRTESASRPFSRRWEDLLEDARLVSGTERSEAEHDAKVLQASGWIAIKPVRYKPHLRTRSEITSIKPAPRSQMPRLTTLGGRRGEFQEKP